MKTKEEIIHAMAFTYRQDYNLRKGPKEPNWTNGMTEEDAKMLYKTMEQLYNSNIEPYMEFKNAHKSSK
jgi:hypothetical protein